MPGITEQMYSILSGITAITSLVPVDRIHPGRAPQGTTLPYIVHFPVVGVPLISYDQVEALRNWEFYQVSVFATGYPEGDTIARAILANLPGNHNGVVIFPRIGMPWFMPSGTVEEEELVRDFHFPLDFDVFEAL